ARDYCTATLPALPEAPVLDGVLDCGPALVPLPVQGWTGTQALPDTQRARYALAWRPNGLYFYVEVDDPLVLPAPGGLDTWCGDGVELYADADGKFAAPLAYDDPGTIQLLAAAPAEEMSTPPPSDVRFHTRSKFSAGDWTRGHTVVRRDGGYALEA